MVETSANSSVLSITEAHTRPSEGFSATPSPFSLPSRNEGDPTVNNTLDDLLGSAFGKDWQLQRPQSSMDPNSSEHRRSYVHYLLGRGEKGAVYHQLWFPGTSLSFSLDPSDPSPCMTSYMRGYDGTTMANDGIATPHMYIKRSVSAMKAITDSNFDNSTFHQSAKTETSEVPDADIRNVPRKTRPISARAFREVKPLEFNPEEMISNSVFDKRKVTKTPRPLSSSSAKKRSKKLQCRSSTPRFPETRDSLEVTGAQSQLNTQLTGLTKRGSTVDPLQALTQKVNDLDTTGSEEYKEVDGSETENDQSGFFELKGNQEEFDDDRPVSRLDVKRVETSKWNENSDLKVPHIIETQATLDKNDSFDQTGMQLVPYVGQKPEVGGGDIGLTHHPRSSSPAFSMSSEREQKDTNVGQPENLEKNNHTEEVTAKLDDTMDANNTTFGSDESSCLQPSANHFYSLPDYKIEKYSVQPAESKVSKGKNVLNTDRPTKMKLPKDERQSYQIISNEPWGFAKHYKPFFAEAIQKLDLENLANANRDWKSALGDTEVSEQDSNFLDRLMEMAKHQSTTVKLEEELRRPRYMRPRSSQLSLNSVTSSGLPAGDSPQRLGTPNGLPRARSALGTMSSRVCPECKQNTCIEGCRYQLQPVPKPAPVFKRCYLCRQMSCQGGHGCGSHRKVQQLQSARYERRVSTPFKASPVGSNSSEGNTRRLQAIEYPSADHKKLIKLSTKTGRSSSRPKSATVSSSRRRSTIAHDTVRNNEPGMNADTESRCSLAQVNLTNNLAGYLEGDTSYKTYLPKPPPTGRDMLTLEQKLSVLSMPVAKLSRSKSNLVPKTVQSAQPRSSKTLRSSDETSKSLKQGVDNCEPSVVELLVPRIALPCQPEPPSVYISVYRSHNLSAHNGRFRGTKRLGGRLTSFT